MTLRAARRGKLWSGDELGHWRHAGQRNAPMGQTTKVVGSELGSRGSALPPLTLQGSAMTMRQRKHHTIARIYVGNYWNCWRDNYHRPGAFLHKRPVRSFWK